MPPSEIVSVALEGDIAWVTINNPPVNATSAAVRAGLESAISKVQGARVAVLKCAGKTFVAGGDMSEFDAAPVEPHLPDVVQQLEDSATPFIALMHGTVLGGGFELAMGCAWRIASAGTRFGLPEVNVGIIPGAGGTQRLPRLIGIQKSVDLACRGQMISADELIDLGGLDVVASGDLEEAAKAFIQSLPDRPKKISETSVEVLSAVEFDTLRSDLKKRAKGQTSPLQNLEALQWAALPFSEGQTKERALHLKMRVGVESKALRHAFFAEREVQKPKAIDGAVARDIRHAAIVGGGLMGAGIATAMLGAGLQVTIIERDTAAAAAANARVAGLLEGGLKRGKISQSKFAQQLGQLTCASGYDAASTADLAIEAVFEDIEVKRAVFAELSAIMPQDAILATNTSYIDPEQIFAATHNQSRCVGLHFFSPAHVMKLLEIVRLPSTAPDVLATAVSLGKRMRKVPVLSGICDGFIGNRMLATYRRAADYLLADGALPYEIDAAMRGFGMPMGPYELQDLTGLQISWANRKRLAPMRDPNERYIPVADQLCEMDRFGQRSGKGWYKYEVGNRAPFRDAEVESLILEHSKSEGISRREYTPAQITKRILAVMANEGARIVDEGIAEAESHIDMVQIHGYGFPRWRGGPMHYASEIGWTETHRNMEKVARESPGSWSLAKRLEDELR
ncbi:FAD-dependent oxidoreductase [Cochlodiniinecator piscidefendens]|uniref:FAD-dependent oxidoreductase n=1 Tax=Cochlodiniinecator piscidefendens TaxID=2715756 RepID=UPI001409DA8B|nr:FAD-dependent oxidoreductase [Cochlodiniinecator piscidefendens]